MNRQQRGLCWKLNWYRQSELEGALLLGKVVRAAREPGLIVALTRHCADEARHACLWADAVEALGWPTIRIFKSYQSFYAARGGLPASLAEALALTHVFERRVWRQFQHELQHSELPAVVRTTLHTLLDDERQHLDWVSDWLQSPPEGLGLVRRFEQIDEAVYAELAPFEDCLWEVPGLGDEVNAFGESHAHAPVGTV